MLYKDFNNFSELFHIINLVRFDAMQVLDKQVEDEKVEERNINNLVVSNHKLMKRLHLVYPI